MKLLQHKRIFHDTLEDLMECSVCKMIVTILQAKGLSTREELNSYIEMAKTTLYDHISHLIQRQIVKSTTVKISKRGRPLVLFEIIQEKEKSLKLNKIQVEIIKEMYSYDLYIHLWGRITGKTTTAIVVAMMSKEPILFISQNNKHQKKVLYHHMDIISKQLLEKNIESGVIFICSQKDYLKKYLDLRKRVGEEGKITVIIDEVYPNGDKIIDILIQENVRLIIFTSLKYYKNDIKGSHEIIRYIENIYHGFYDFGKTILMDTTFCPTYYFVKEFKNPKTDCIIDQEKMLFMKNNLSDEKFATEFSCDMRYISGQEVGIFE